MEELRHLIEHLWQEAAQIQIQGRALTPDEIERVRVIYQALPHLEEAVVILTPKVESTLITYKIVSDVGGRLKKAARTSCNFWNRFVYANSSIVIRLDTFTAASMSC